MRLAHLVFIGPAKNTPTPARSRGLRVGINSRGSTSLTAGIPGTGVHVRAQTRGRRTQPGLRVMRCLVASPLGLPTTRAYARGLLALVAGQRDRAHPYFEQVDADSALFFAGYTAPEPVKALALLKRFDPRKVCDRRLRRYYIDPAVSVGVTPAVVTVVGIDPTTLALLLAEAHQSPAQTDDAIAVLKAAPPTPARNLSLAELLCSQQRWAEVRDLTRETRNQDDLTCQTLVFRARALCALGNPGSALEALRLALNSSKRGIVVLLEARYERALVHEAMGSDDKARKEFETVHAMDNLYRDVELRVKQAGTPLAELPAMVPPAMRLREARRRAGMTQRELASASGVGQQTISKIEVSAVRPKRETMERLLKACGVTGV